MACWTLSALGNHEGRTGPDGPVQPELLGHHGRHRRQHEQPRPPAGRRPGGPGAASAQSDDLGVGGQLGRAAGRAPDGLRDPAVHVGVEHARHDVGGVQLVVGDHRRQRPGRGEQHRRGDLGRPGVQQPTEHPGERQHVVDLVGEVASGRWPPPPRAGSPRPGRSPAPGWPARTRSPDPPSSPPSAASITRGADTPMNTSAPTSASFSEHSRLSGLVFSASHSSCPADPRPGPVHDAVDVGHHHVPDPGRQQQLHDRRPGRPRTGHHDPDLRDVLLHHPQRVVQRGQHHDRRAVLIVVEHRDVQLLAQPAPRSRSSAARRCPPG